MKKLLATLLLGMALTVAALPAAAQESGNTVTMTANASQVSDSAEFRVAVETSMVWGFVAVVVIVALLAGIGYVFRKYGRR